MEYDELLGKIMKERKANRGERFIPPDVEVTISGQKTVVGADKFAKYINRPLIHISKYLMHELTAPGQVDENGKIIIGGKFSKKLVIEKLNSYIKEYVMCKQCNSPDTQMTKIENNFVVKCLACGAEYPVGKIK
ncbi:MAG: translation initiation factor IF-2 subunit beta [Candidatus Parvarchaeota archaeon]|nr:translation initiation factor IF-2 subunit beta [Candidatus Parvarchaeota archaeon]MCL5101596.1 translation initiation factor IF-2 subunit beta [Candidatus Parvarchaeota archaeon]